MNTLRIFDVARIRVKTNCDEAMRKFLTQCHFHCAPSRRWFMVQTNTRWPIYLQTWKYFENQLPIVSKKWVMKFFRLEWGHPLIPNSTPHPHHLGVRIKYLTGSPVLLHTWILNKLLHWFDLRFKSYLNRWRCNTQKTKWARKKKGEISWNTSYKQNKNTELYTCSIFLKSYPGTLNLTPYSRSLKVGTTNSLKRIVIPIVVSHLKFLSGKI